MMGIILIQILQIVALFAISIPLSALMLMISTKIFKLRDTSYLTAIKAALVVEIAGLLFVFLGFVPALLLDFRFIFLGAVFMFLKIIFVTILLAIFMVKYFYKLKKIDKILLVWLVWIIFKTIVLFITNIMLMAIFGLGGSIIGGVL
jgi:hypothetical protein